MEWHYVIKIFADGKIELVFLLAKAVAYALPFKAFRSVVHSSMQKRTHALMLFPMKITRGRLKASFKEESTV